MQRNLVLALALSALVGTSLLGAAEWNATLTGTNANVKAYGGFFGEPAGQTLVFGREPSLNKGVSGGLIYTIPQTKDPVFTMEAQLRADARSPQGNMQVSEALMIGFFSASGKENCAVTLRCNRYHQKRILQYSGAFGMANKPCDYPLDKDFRVRVTLDTKQKCYQGAVIVDGKEIANTGSQPMPEKFVPTNARVIVSTANNNDGLKVAFQSLQVKSSARSDLEKPVTPKEEKSFQPAAGELIPVFKNKYSFKLEPGTAPTEKTVEFPAIVPRKGYSVLLRFDARIATPGIGGWNPWFAVTLNGKPLGKYTANSTPRLLLRGATMKSTIEPEKDWWQTQGKYSAIMVFFAPESEVEVDVRMRTARDQRYVYTLDVTDLANFAVIGADDRIEGGKPNTVTFTDLLSSGVCKSPLAVKNVELLYVPETTLGKMSGQSLTEFKPSGAVKSLPFNGGKLDVTAQGGMVLTVGKDTYFLESNYSYVAKPEMKFNRFTVSAKPEGRADWKVSVAGSGKTVTVKGEFPDYRVERTLTLAGHRIAVQEKITNLSGKDLGLRWNRRIGKAGTIAAGVRLAGQSNTSVVNFFGSSNSTVYFPGKTTAVGLLAEDTVSRAQLELRATGNIAQMGSVGTGLPAQKTLTLDWAIYPLNRADYWDFINAVRRDWGVNCTVLGPYAGHEPKLTFSKAAVKVIQPWHNYSSGAGKNDEEFIKMVQENAAAARAANPDIKLLGMVETNLVPFDTTTVDWGKELHPRVGARNQPGVKYGLFMSKELTDKLDKVSPLADSVVRDENGCAMYENYYTSAPFVNLMVQPEKGNYRFETFKAQIDFLMDKVGMDGIYIDQFQPYIVGGFSENRWDGYTVELAADGTIARKRYSYAITGAASRAELVKYIRSKGGIVVINGQPMSREEQNDGRMAFQEMENDDVNPLKFLNVKPPERSWEVLCHLGTPIALGLRPHRYLAQGATKEQYPQIQMKGVITALRNGTLFYFYTLNAPEANSGVVLNMFPLTPVELHEGYIIGKERTVTALSGTYQVGGKKAPQVLGFDKVGLPKEFPVKVTGNAGKWQVELKLDDWNEAAIIVVQE